MIKETLVNDIMTEREEAMKAEGERKGVDPGLNCISDIEITRR